MKNKLMILFALLAMFGCASINKNLPVAESQQAGTVADKLISLINDYTDKISAVESVYDMFFVSEKCYKDKMYFERDNADAIAAFKSELTEDVRKAFDDAVKGAMDKFEAAVNKKAKELAGEQDAAGEKK